MEPGESLGEFWDLGFSFIVLLRNEMEKKVKRKKEYCYAKRNRESFH